MKYFQFQIKFNFENLKFKININYDMAFKLSLNNPKNKILKQNNFQCVTLKLFLI